MDCIFNTCIPHSTKDRIIIRPYGKTFVNGMAASYDFHYPREFLSSVLSEADFTSMMQDINDCVQSFWPCCFCFSFGYGCALCTLGLSLFAPFMCINDARDYLESRIDFWNRTFLAEKGLKMSLNFGCSTSWVF